MQVYERRLSDIVPYENNPRNNDSAVDKVAASIQEFGWKQPIVVDSDGVIIAGHTRLRAAEKLGLETVPVVVADDLTEEQVAAYRLADNKTSEFAGWDFGKLDEELFRIDDIDMSLFGFDMDALKRMDGQDFFKRENRNDTEREEGNEEYNEFLDKFEEAKTTDDCYTPELVYEAVAEWVATEYSIDRSRFVRPFYPGGDYQRYKYEDGAVVVDNPPFSILAEILTWYKEKGVDFFLFAPSLTLFSSSSSCALPVGVTITYENNAQVATSFLTSLEDKSLRVRTAPSLYKAVDEANKEWRKDLRRELPKYSYPDEVITSTMLAKWSKYGVNFSVAVEDTAQIDALDAQKAVGKTIYGKGYLLSEKAAAEKAAAEKAAAEKAAAEKAAAEKAAVVRWQLSERERQIVRSLGRG